MLGGDVRAKYATAALFIALWFIYIIMSILMAYEVIPPLNA
jgi:hypothetical protein